ncbi:MAG: type II CRISPR RNA-guided endonuclease Cas9 [Verrucomicrobiia bacterium]
MQVENFLNTVENRELEVAFDVGHSSIGWAVLSRKTSQESQNVAEYFYPEIIGCGVVIFEPDTCLAKKRRDYRRQRRHIRTTRQRIKRMKALLLHLGVLTETELDKPGNSSPWKLAAEVLQNVRLLSWQELWDVLRWYAHNRGYDENRLWSEIPAEGEEDESERVENARKLMQEYKCGSMAETVCKMLGVDPHSTNKRSTHLRYKGTDIAFPRNVVVREVREILKKHIGKLPQVSEQLVETLTGDKENSWKTIPCPSINLPKRYYGSLLFGQLLPRFNNRNIARCPISGEKLTLKECVEFYRYRWAMLLCNIRVKVNGSKERPLNVNEREYINGIMEKKGFFTKHELRTAVNDAVMQTLKNENYNGIPVILTNISAMFLTEDMEKALTLYPVKKIINSEKVQVFWNILPERLQKKFAGMFRRGKQLTPKEIRDYLEKLFPEKVKDFDSAVAEFLKMNKKEKNYLESKIPDNPLKALQGRAPFSKTILKKAYEEVLQGRDPREKGGCLFRSEEIRLKELNRKITEQTNNHLIRHRLLILERLFDDIVKEYANNDKNRIGQVTIEVNRDLREFSGKTAKEIASELTKITADHRKAVQDLEENLKGTKHKITASLIRKTRIAMDLDWTCPYTGQKYDIYDLLEKRVDLDHIIPQSIRPSNSLESLVITFPEVNRFKAQRLAFQFVKEEQTKTVKGLPNLQIRTLENYKNWVENLKESGFDRNKSPQSKRKKLLLLPEYVQEEFLPRDLTQTSQLVRLAAQVIRKKYVDSKEPKIVSMPGSVTAVFRKSWKVIGCLSKAVPAILDENGEVRPKDEIRNITHLHHAVDACVLALASHLFPNNGRLWELLVKNKLNSSEVDELKKIPLVQVGVDNKINISDLPEFIKEQISNRLLERRVVQHISKDMSGLKCEETAWRVVEQNTDNPYGRKLLRWCKAKNIEVPGPDSDSVLIVSRTRKDKGTQAPTKILHETNTFWWQYEIVKKSKVIGLYPENGDGKLKKLKAVKKIGENWGLALDPKPQVIRALKIYKQVQEIRKANDGKPPRILRKGQLIFVPKGRYKGVWKVFSLKENETGLSLDMGYSDTVRLKNKMEGHKINVLLSTLIKDGLKLLNTPYTGINACLIT